MALPRNFRFPVSFDNAFPEGALAVSEVEPANERQSPQDRSRGLPPRQRMDPVTGLPVWKLTISDPSSPRDGEKSVTVEILAAEQPELPEPVPGMPMNVRVVRFEDLTAQPRLGGQGEFRYLTFAYRASGIVSALSGSKPGPKSGRSSGGSSAGSEGS
ncbi:hypothetical protein [Saccharopolyspora sp. NPDC050642]|uniref:hypothetical protein n=1 Tax=Saccharopolyspora sp. NPDC050642 TaxID=3157099 RepID=UPI0033D22262